MELYKWKIYCNTESTFVEGFLPENSGKPQVCFNNNTHSIGTVSLIEKITSMTDIIYKWQVYCDTEKINVSGYLGPHVYPDFCFNNKDHVVSKKAVELAKYNNNLIKIQEEPYFIKGFFRTRAINISIAANETKVYDITWPFNIAPLAVTLLPTIDNLNDSLTIDVSPNKIVGTLTANAEIGVTTLSVSPTVIEYIEIGFYCSLYDGTNTNELGYVLAKNFVNNTITVEVAPTNQFLATTPTYVRLTVQYLGPWDIYSIGNQNIPLGNSKIGSSSILANEIVRLTYVNNSASAKTFSSYVEFLY